MYSEAHTTLTQVSAASLSLSHDTTCTAGSLGASCTETLELSGVMTSNVTDWNRVGFYDIIIIIFVFLFRETYTFHRLDL